MFQEIICHGSQNAHIINISPPDIITGTCTVSALSKRNCGEHLLHLSSVATARFCNRAKVNLFLSYTDTYQTTSYFALPNSLGGNLSTSSSVLLLYLYVSSFLFQLSSQQQLLQLLILHSLLIWELSVTSLVWP